jgi:hypothetical protein
MRWHFIDNETEYANLGRRQLIVTSLLPRQNEEWSGSTSIYAESEAGILPMGLLEAAQLRLAVWNKY